MAAWEIALDSLTEVYAGLRSHRVASTGHLREAGMTDEDMTDIFNAAELAAGNAIPIYVAQDIAGIWQHAVLGFRQEALLPSDLLFDCGFVHLETVVGFVCPPELATPTWVGEQCFPVDSFLWERDSNGVAIWTFSHRDNYDHHDVELLEVGMQGASFISAEAARTAFHPMMMSGVTFMPFDTVLVSPFTPVQVLWSLMRQFVPARKRAERHARRRAARGGIRHSDVTVIRLRRESARYRRESAPVDWDHRWIVRGHWRNQWHPSLKSHRQKYIAPYVKGPDDRPLIVTEKAVEFLR
jgi:hypothetical protein